MYSHNTHTHTHSPKKTKTKNGYYICTHNLNINVQLRGLRLDRHGTYEYPQACLQRDWCEREELRGADVARNDTKKYYTGGKTKKKKKKGGKTQERENKKEKEKEEENKNKNKKLYLIEYNKSYRY
jgi:hypothetical protein